MEKSQTEFLQECLAEIAALKERITALEEKIAAYEPAQEEDLPPAEEEVDFTDIEIGVPEETPVIQREEKNPQPEAENLQPEVEDETAHLPWRTDKPGLPVKNIRSGISLLDRALFIGTLFKEDFALYDKTIADLNAMSSLDQAVDYIREHFPSWNLKSDVVYHFMMSVRKKLS